MACHCAYSSSGVSNVDQPMKIKNMHRRAVLVSLLAMLTHHTASAGAWGHESFQNDDALDWLGEFLEAPSPGSVAAALNAVLKPGPIDGLQGASAIAAAEVIAAALGKPAQRPSAELTAWLKGANRADFQKLKKLAGRAVNAVISGEQSELRRSWSLHREDLILWQANGHDLLQRLGEPRA